MDTVPGFNAEFKAFTDSLPRSEGEKIGFAHGWAAAMKFMAQPRIVATPVHKEPDQVAERYVTDEPMITWSERDLEIMRRACKQANPYGLVAFYTDAP